MYKHDNEFLSAKMFANRGERLNLDESIFAKITMPVGKRFLYHIAELEKLGVEAQFLNYAALLMVLAERGFEPAKTFRDSLPTAKIAGNAAPLFFARNEDAQVVCEINDLSVAALSNVDAAELAIAFKVPADLTREISVVKGLLAREVTKARVDEIVSEPSKAKASPIEIYIHKYGIKMDISDYINEKIIRSSKKSDKLLVLIFNKTQLAKLKSRIRKAIGLLKTKGATKDVIKYLQDLLRAIPVMSQEILNTEVELLRMGAAAPETSQVTDVAA